MAAALTRTKRVINLSPSEFKACYSLNLRDGGLMRGTLLRYRHNPDAKTYATLRYNKDGSLAGWALTFPCEYKGAYLNAYFYVRKAQRRSGVGKSLVGHVNKKFGMVRVFPHDYKSQKFFNFVHANNLNVNIDSRYN